ncbi:helix-turn-helix domain-containing protein [Pseudonocardia sp. N23]|uniref:helix-turn-helix domain-containing protein n=1 Tax=Pseudonocardia sp. N23 TaxID=1987376 RepID=UPI000C0340A7|nr:cupin domain-containing protein [Pseudonocardia sp. N23]GAY07417.1 transcriptional regulator, MerR family [Pseudonocardia sp. N23]
MATTPRRRAASKATSNGAAPSAAGPAPEGPAPDVAVPDGAEAEQARPAAWETIVGAIGPKVREVRRLHGLSLQQLAARSEVSAAAIHKVERGDMVPTITTLLKLSAALGRPIGFFVDDAEWAGPVGVHVRAAERPVAPADWAPSAQGVEAGAIAVPGERLHAGAVWARIEPGGNSGEARSVRSGEELVLVVDGSLTVDIAGEVYRLEQGDSLQFPADRPHSWRNTGRRAANVAWWYLHG